MNKDNLADIIKGIELDMPKIAGGQLYHKTIHITKYSGGALAKNSALNDVEQNEKFLNKYQSLIEDNLPQKQLEQFVEYQNWNFQHGMGELSKLAASNYTNSSDHWKEGLFNSCECKEKRQIEKTIRESMIGTNNLFSNKWTNLVPPHTNFSYQTFATFSNASLNRASCEDATSEIGGYSPSVSYSHGSGKACMTGFDSGIGVAAFQNYNTIKQNYQAVEVEGIDMVGCMYDSADVRVGTGLALMTGGSGTGERTWAASTALDVLCTGDATIRAAVGYRTSPNTKIQAAYVDNGGGDTWATPSMGGGAMQAGFETGLSNTYAQGWKFSFV